MTPPTKICKVCGEYKTHHARGMCGVCYHKWYSGTQYNSFNTNPSSPSYLGIHVAERVLAKVFKNVKQMPTNNPGYDFVCNKGKKIDVKSSCIRKNRISWAFSIAKNTTADYFLCIAFDNRENLSPQHLWLIPGEKINHLTNTSITKSTLYRWTTYKIDVNSVVNCCNMLR